jgi:hypothetical protein
MHFQHATGVIAAVWIVGAGVIGLLTNVTSLGAAVAVLGVGLLPPLLLLVRVKPAGARRTT